MTESALLMTVRLIGGRYHGLPEWPPSPFRLYQALLGGGMIGEPDERAEKIRPIMEWLEQLPPPVIAAPPARRGQRLHMYMPNNDLDTVGGDPRYAARIRGAEKQVQPRLLEADTPFCYVWSLRAGDERAAEDVFDLASRLYQLGRGIDMAYASAEILPDAKAYARLVATGSVVYTPHQEASSEETLPCPVPGSYHSLLKRHRAQRSRLAGGHLTQAPPASFQAIPYNAEPRRLLYELVATTDKGTGFYPVSTIRATWLVERVRDQLALLLGRAFGDDLVERIVVGRGAKEADKSKRVVITPLPSVGSPHADHAIRRIVVTVPPDCPIPAQEVDWAAGAVHLGVNANGEIVEPEMPQLVRASDERMLKHYGAAGRASRVWRTVTPVALPVRPSGRRRTGEERGAYEARAAGAVQAALRHAGITMPAERIRVQREPFEPKGATADAFEVPRRLVGRPRYHVEITFPNPRQEPLLLGDGRFIGLGVFVPIQDNRADALVFSLPDEARLASSEPARLLTAVRRALMALARDEVGRGKIVPKLFSGHEQDGAPASATGRHEHIFLAATDSDDDGLIDRLYVIAPWAGDRSNPVRRSEALQFESVVCSLGWLSIPGVGRVSLHNPEIIDDDDPIIRKSSVWESATAYRLTRHPKRDRSTSAIEEDVICECMRRGLPRPSVDVLDYKTGPNGGSPRAYVRLQFAVAVRGPLLLGLGSHAGNGLFSS